jgi:hypothetical protein
MTARLGKLVLTFDLELAWGSVENGSWARLEQAGVFARTRPAIESLLGVMDDCSIPAVWAAVGAMLEEPGEWQLDYLPAVVRGPIEQLVERAHLSSVDGRDLVQMIYSARQPHVFGCHTYGHVRFGHPAMTAEIASRDLELFAERRALIDRASHVFIFPCNDERHWDVVRRHGYQWCRASARMPYQGTGWRRWADRLHRLVATPPLTERETLASGLIRCTDSLLFNTGGRAAMVGWLKRRALRGLRRAADEGGEFHVGTHPFNLAETEGLLESLQSFLFAAGRLRDAGRLEISIFGRDERQVSVA